MLPENEVVQRMYGALKKKEKENRSKEMKPEVTHPAIFFFVKHKEDLTGGTTAEKTSPPPCYRSSAAGTGAERSLLVLVIE